MAASSTITSSSTITRSFAQAAVAAYIGTDNLTFRGMTLDTDGEGIQNWTGEVNDNTCGDLYDFCVPCDYPEAIALELLA
tara:strand:- start:547 stop:786 length:240 start_codon:yes stop_codon:yes gene_type:complete